MRITVLGKSPAWQDAGGACSGYLVDDGTTRLWVDAGSGTLANLQRHLPLDQLDALVLSHEHPDHWTDLEGFFNVCRYVAERSGVPIYAPAGLRERTYTDTEPFFDWREVADGDAVSVGTLDLRFSRTDHGPETLAVRIDGGGRSLGYSADTGPGWSLEALGTGLDLALCEAALPSSEEGSLQHLSARQAGFTARAAGAARLLLTHLWPTLAPTISQAAGSEAFGEPVALAVINERYEV